MGYGDKQNTIGEWSIDKLSFIKKYLPIYSKATQKALHRYYIDAFAGNGEWIHRVKGGKVPGSATIALENISGFTNQFFIEMDDARVANLYRLIESFDAKDKAKIYQGDCNTVLPNILMKIHKKAPAFVFLDPSADQVEWETIEFLSKWKTELFILYPYHITIQRFLPKNKNSLKDWQRERLNKFFGTNKWEDIYMEKHRDYLCFELLELYTNNLRNIGYSYANISEVFKTPGGQKLYFMIWVGKSPVGKKLMDWVFQQQQVQMSLFE
jgi:three-Cys-motif partner protein